MGRRRAAAAVEASPFYQSRRQAIIEAAAKVFRTHGYEAATFAHVAEELNTDRASLYYYASSKQELFEEIIRQASEQNVNYVEAIVAGGGTASDKLRSAFERLMESYASDYPYFRFFLQIFLQGAPSEKSSLGQENREWAERYYRAIRNILQQGVDSGEFVTKVPIGVAAIGAIGTINWIQVAGIGGFENRSISEGNLGPRELGRAMAELVLSGLARS